MVRIVIVFAALALGAMVVAFIDAALTPRGTTGVMPKWVWMIVIALLPLVGALLWWYAGRPRAHVGGVSGASTAASAGGGSAAGYEGLSDQDARLRGMNADERIAWLEQQLADIEAEENHHDGDGKTAKGDQ